MSETQLIFYAQPSFSGWMPTAIFQSLYDHYKFIYGDRIALDNTSISYNNNYGHRTGPHHLIIENTKTQKYKVITYWDRAYELLDDKCDWNNNNCMGVYSSVNAKSHNKIIPASYPTYNTIIENTISECNKRFLDKLNKTLVFRGYLHGSRFLIGHLNQYQNIITIDDKRLSYEEYIQELNSYMIGLSLNGSAEICNRDIEILGVGSVLLRPELKTSYFHNPLIAGKHYVPFEINEDPRQQLEIILDTHRRLLKDVDYMMYVAQNGLNWYNSNGCRNGNVLVLSNIINLEELL
jgi:hypothetical protein